MLSCYRVLDLTDEKGYACGKVLSDLGAEVIKVEPPGGDLGRSRGPFFHDIPDPEKSLYWFAFNTNKKGITLDIQTLDGREIFKQLVKKADIVLESFPPGYMDKLGLGYNTLRKINSGIIVTAMTPFGQEGPYRNFKGSDIVVSALGGTLYAVGDPDRPPLTSSYPHSYLINSMHAAVGTLMALYQRSATGQGQYVDCPAQASLLFTAAAEIEAPWAFESQTLKRKGRKRIGVTLKKGDTGYYPVLWKCRDGDVAFSLFFGPPAEKSMQNLVQWMRSEGYDPGRLGHWDFQTQDWSSLETQAEVDEVVEVIQSFFLKHTKRKLFEKAVEIEIKLGISLTVKDMLEFPHSTPGISLPC